MNTTLAVYLRDEHGIQPQGFGSLIGMNALMVVALQFSVTRRIRQHGYPSMLVLAAARSCMRLASACTVMSRVTPCSSPP